MTANKWTADDIPDQSGRVAVITGANSGLGLETARELARKGATIVMAVRSLERGAAAVADIKGSVQDDAPDADVRMQQLDLASLASIEAAAEAVSTEHPRVDLLINNAGVMWTPKQQTADGFEMQFGTNHLGHFAWTGRMLPTMLDVEGSRVVTVASLAHTMRSTIDFDDLQAENGYDRVSAYGRSKLANLLFTYELQRRLAQAAESGSAEIAAKTVALAAHPGVSATELASHLPAASLLQPVMSLFMQSSKMGALPTLRAATDPAAEGGQYYGPDGFSEYRGHPVVVTSAGRSHKVGDQQRLWSESEELTSVTFPV